MKAPLFVAEHLAFYELGRDGCAVDCDKGAPGTRTSGVDQASGNLFAGAALAKEQHRGAGRGHLLQLRDDSEHLGVLGNELVVLNRGPLFLVLAQAAALESAFGEKAELSRSAERLGQVFEGAELHRLDGRFDGAVSGEQNHFHLGHRLAGVFEKIHPISSRHLQVGEHQVKALPLEAANRLVPVGGSDHVVPLGLERFPHVRADALFVVDDQDACHAECLLLFGRELGEVAG